MDNICSKNGELDRRVELDFNCSGPGTKKPGAGLRVPFTGRVLLIHYFVDLFAIT